MAIRHINWFFNLFNGRRAVPEYSLRCSPELIRLHLDEIGCPESETLPDHVLRAVAQEAYRRAGSAEADKRARIGPYHMQIQQLAREIAAALRKEPAADARIRNILEWNRVI